MNPSLKLACWYVVRTKPRRELMVSSLLERYSELTVFLPEVLHLGAKGKTMTPLFPGYLFVQLDLNSSPAGALIHTPGVLGLVGSERRPTPVADEIVERLQQRVAKVNQGGGLPVHGFRPGDSVRLTGGPLQGLDAIFVGPLTPTERVQVLLHFLGQAQEIEVDVRQLEAGNPAPPPPPYRPRRTRGAGRPIRERV